MGNSPFSKEDFKNGIPFLVIGKESSFDFLYSNEVNKNNNITISFNENIEDVLEKLKPFISDLSYK